MTNTFHILANLKALNEAIADFIIAKATTAIETKGRCAISLSGGSTPKQLFETLAQEKYKSQLDWTKVYFFWGDERCVAPTSDESNSRMARLALLDHIDISENNIFPIDGTLEPNEAAVKYETTLKQFFGKEKSQFDIMLLGLGTDGHTASLFPFTDVVNEKEAWVKAVYLKDIERWRISMTAPLISQAKDVLFLAAGDKKASILFEILNDKYQPNRYPSQLIIKNSEQIHWFLDDAAATQIRG